VALILAIMLGSYLLGSVNAGIVISRVFKGEDIRKHGSGNAGMTNILRTYGKGLAVLTALIDFGKAAVAIVLARLLVENFALGLPLDVGYIAGICAMLGHLFPIYFRFKGGKGVMTAVGVVLLVNPLALWILIVLFLPVIFVTRYVSLGSVLGAASYPVITWILGRSLYDTLFAVVIGLLIIVMHKENIRRLCTGTENRFGGKKGG